MSMRILFTATAIAAGLGVATAPASAQTPSPAAPTTAPAPVVTPTPAPAFDMFFKGEWSPTHWRSSEAVGQPVYNKGNERIGEVEELLINGEGRVFAAVVAVGGFLGIGERRVALSYSAFQMTRDANGKSRLVVNVDKASLEKAPAYEPVPVAKRT